MNITTHWWSFEQRWNNCSGEFATVVEDFFKRWENLIDFGIEAAGVFESAGSMLEDAIRAVDLLEM